MKTVKKLLSWVLCLALVLAAMPLALADVTPVPITSVNVLTSNLSLRIGGTDTLEVTISPGNTTMSTAVYYSSSNPGVASVSSYGVVTAQSVGYATITVTSAADPTKYGTCSVSVLADTQITLDKSSLSLQQGYTGYLTASVSPYEISAKGVTFTSSNSAVASVSNNGTNSATIIGSGQGVATIYATTSDGKTATCAVTVGVPVTEVKISHYSVNVSTGSTFNLSASVLPANATQQGITWSSSNTNVATVNAAGQVTTWRSGTAVISATASDGSGKSATCTVTATGIDVTPIPTATPTPTLAPTLQPGVTPTPPTGGVIAYVNTPKGSPNLRATASQNATILDTIPENGSFTLLNHGTTWCYVWYRGNYGYVMTKFVRMDRPLPTQVPWYTATPEPSVSPAPGSPSGTVAFVNTEKGSLNLRASANANSQVLRRIPERGAFTVITYGTTWCYAWYNGSTGYVMTKFIRLAGSTALPTGGTPKPATAVTPSPVPLTGSVASVISGNLNLRSAPSTASTRVRLIHEGAVIDILTYGKEWCYARYKGVAGYVMTKFLNLGTGVNKGTSSGTGTAVIVTAAPTAPVSNGINKYAQVSTAKGGLNLRKGAGMGYARITIIPQNAYVTVVQDGATWTQVSYNGVTGYVMTKFLKKV